MLSQSYCRKIAFAVLAVFLTSLGAWSFNTKRIAHDLGHDLGHDSLMAQLATIEHSVTHHHGDTGRGDDHDTLTDAEHSLLHAAGQVQPVPLSSFAWAPPQRVGAIRSLFIPPLVARSSREPPFRPPRIILS